MSHAVRTTFGLAAACIGSFASGCDDFFYVCPVADEAALAALPDRLSDTGLYTDIDQDELSPGVMVYRPQFELWSDGAVKRRFLKLPPGTQIDTSDMDVWRFPAGTKLWKEFSRDGIRVETRILDKTGPGDTGWASLAYVWNDEGTDALAAPAGFVDARGTPHNVPGAGECVGCHGGRKSFVLGASAVQLSFDAEPGDVDLSELDAQGLLSDSPGDVFAVPGDQTERAALGYLHANCGHCHNQDRPSADVAPCMDPENELDFWLRVGALSSPEATPTYQSAIGDKIEPGNPDGSAVIERVSSRRLFFRMPPLGSEQVDRDAVTVLRRWIEELE